MAEKLATRFASRDDTAALFTLINEAYSVETGTDAVAFKRTTRLLSDDEILPAIGDGRCLVIDGPVAILGCIVFEIDLAESMCCFGPFAVSPAAQGRGIGSRLIREVEAVARDAHVKWLGMSVINHRSDIIPMYRAMGFSEYGTAPYPASHVDRLSRPSHFILLRRSLPEAC